MDMQVTTSPVTCIYMEHLNNTAKLALEGLGAKKTEKTITRVGKAIGTMIDTFDTVDNVPSVSGAHSKKSSEKHLNKIFGQLVKSGQVRQKTEIISTPMEKQTTSGHCLNKVRSNGCLHD